MKQESEKQEEKSLQAEVKTSILQNPVVVVAIITALGVVIGAFVTGGFGLVTKYVETKSDTNLSTQQNKNIETSSNYNVSNISANSKQENQNAQIAEKVVAKPIALGTRQTLTLVPATTDSLEWKYSCCNNEMIFVSPNDKNNWAKLTVSGKEHFVGLRVELTDSFNDIDIKTLSTGQIKELENILLETKSFKAIITPTEVKTGDDPDPERQYPLVFKKVALSLKVEENKESNDKAKTK